ncbi:CHAD domain-containing super protein [Pseudomonas savastanoi pv. glycinea]|uniref:CHAD domain-containing protein n=1 Tax=Pseudomonas quasicaspiana TaxID=2829821 RepID=UPI000F0079D6|nr:CHAD domain-containing protein [Pseudomonas quasicaspiana]MCD5977133.1 CHAD domain-containing protein [Pseudomonas quasicaspiana]MCQ3030790.1 CHAD domain-containing protein [Pseudomonas syringae]RMQ94437.1 CHAD domain-containing super protein [Pseudomonas savastanoi pv. glycinea]
MSSMVDHLVAQVLGLHVKLLACQARLAASTDPEALHDLRTTVRRLRSLLRPLRGVSGVEQLEAAAKAVGELTTPLRDMEVLAAHLAEQGLADAASVRINKVSKAYGQVATSAELGRLFSTLDQFPGFLRVQQRQQLLRGLRKTIEKGMDKQWKKLREAIADPAHDRHRLRLLIKRVRYAADAYPELSHQPKKMQSRLKAAQGALGDWHDHLQWLAQAGQERDLAPCIAAWQTGIVRAEKKADVALLRLSKTCFG